MLLSLGRLRDVAGAAATLCSTRAIEELAAGLQEIRELASGLHPSVLAERGLAPALEALALRAPVPVELQMRCPTGRLPEQVEAAAYYVVAEGLANVHKHAGARRVVVEPNGRRPPRREVRDDGVGGADEEGSGLRGLADRVEALGGRLMLESPAGRGTQLLAEMPLDSATLAVGPL